MSDARNQSEDDSTSPPYTIELAASGETIAAITLDTNIVIVAGTHLEYTFRIESDVVLSTDEHDVRVTYGAYTTRPRTPTHIDELATLVHQRIVNATAGTDGVLRLSFDGEPARLLTVHPDDRYEAWTYAHRNYILSCPPGGRMNPLPDAK